MTEPISMALAANVKRLRTDAGVSMASLADAARKFGVNWVGGSIGKLEEGKYKASVENLVVIACALTEVTGRDTTIHDLLATDEQVRITPSFDLSSATVLEFLAGSTIGGGLDRDITAALPALKTGAAELFSELSQHGPPGNNLSAFEKFGRITEADKRIARSLDMSDSVFTAWSIHLWGKTFVDERDARAGAGNAQHRGRVTRELKAEIQSAYTTRVPGDRVTWEDMQKSFEQWENRIREGSTDGND